MIAEKGVELDREVKYLVNKAKIAKAEKDRERMKKEAEERQKAEEKKKADEKEKKKKKKKDKANKDTKDEVKDGTKADEVKEQTEEQAEQKEEEPVLSEEKLEPEPEVDGEFNLDSFFGWIWKSTIKNSNPLHRILFVVLSDGLVELVPDLIWYHVPFPDNHPSTETENKHLVFENFQIPRFSEKFRRQDERQILLKPEPAASFVWTTIIVAVIHFLFEIFRWNLVK